MPRALAFLTLRSRTGYRFALAEVFGVAILCYCTTHVCRNLTDASRRLICNTSTDVNAYQSYLCYKTARQLNNIPIDRTSVFSFSYTPTVLSSRHSILEILHVPVPPFIQRSVPAYFCYSAASFPSNFQSL